MMAAVGKDSMSISQWAVENRKLIEEMQREEKSSRVMIPSDENKAGFLKINHLFREIVVAAREEGVDFKKNPNTSFRHHDHDIRKLSDRSPVDALERATGIKGIVGEDGSDMDRVRVKMLTGSYRGILSRFWTRTNEVLDKPKVPDLQVEASKFPTPDSPASDVLAVTLVHSDRKDRFSLK